MASRPHKKLKLILWKLFPQARPGFDIIKIIDVPGLFDSRLEVNEEEIFAGIKKTLLESGVNTLDVFFLFESARDDSRKIRETLKSAIKLFGESLKASSIILTTKWDKLNARELKLVEPEIEKIASGYGIQTQKWFNNYVDYDKFTKKQMKSQFAELGSKIQKLKKYKVAEMDKLLRKKNLLAEKLREQDPERFVIEEHEKEVLEAEEYIEEETFNVTEWVPLTENEIEIKAEKMWKAQIPIPGGMIPRKVVTEVTKTVIDYVPKITTSYFTFETGTFFIDEHVIPIQNIKMVAIEKNITELVIDFEFDKEEDRKLDINFFKNMLEGQAKQITVNKVIPLKKVRTKPVIKKFTFSRERHSFEHYEMLAVKQIQKEIVDSLKSK